MPCETGPSPLRMVAAHQAQTTGLLPRSMRESFAVPPGTAYRGEPSAELAGTPRNLRATLDQMPLYEFRCETCGAHDEVFARSVNAEVKAPPCTRCAGNPAMIRAISRFARHLTLADQVAEAEAKFGAEVDGAMGPGPDVGRMTRRYDRLSKDLPIREGP